MRTQSFAGSLLFFIWSIDGSAASCPGPLGDSFCQSITDSSGSCVPGAWTCSGTQIDCGCDFSAGIIVPETPSPSPLPPTTTSKPPTSSLSTVSTLKPSSSPASTTTTTITVTTTASAEPDVPSGQCGTSPRQPLFVWIEWPGQADAVDYYSKLLSFVSSNCGNFGVTRIILRINDPSIPGLWTVDTGSSVYVNFLSKLPAGVELHLYPYVLVAAAQNNWSSYRTTGQPLEGVFKYASDWNMLLASSGQSARFTGVVLDGEERIGFMNELPNVATYKSKYSIGKLGVAIGFDQPGAVATYPQADDFYLEMYDFYVVDAAQLTLVQTKAADTPNSVLSTLETQVLYPFVAKYTDPRFHFMWSVQAKSRSDCLYPLGSGCGSSDDFGLFSAPDFNQFLQSVQAKYPVLAGRSHGIFQFSFLPPGWM